LSSQYGYVILIEGQPNGQILVGTSNNYFLIMNPYSLSIIAYALIPTGPITSFAFDYLPIWVNHTLNNIYYVTTKSKCYAYYYFPSNNNYEIGLNYFNASGGFQLLTYDGNSTGMAMTGIFNASTNFTMTLILDSNRPSG
jgi:hypothetical protein